MRKIIDTFLYYNEIELLELRLRLLYNYVDKFVIVEGDHTHKGNPTPLRCNEDLKKLGYENDPKIHVIEMNLKPYNEEPDPWKRSDPQRNAQSSICEDDDIVIIADVDEIYHPNYIEDHAKFLDSNPDYVLINRLYDLQGNCKWALHDKNNNISIVNATLVAKGSFFKKIPPTEVRRIITKGGDARTWDFKVSFLNDVKFGWHLSWFGNSDLRLSKVNTSCHWMDKLNEGNQLDSDYSIDRIKNFEFGKTNGDLVGRSNFTLKKFDPSELLRLVGTAPHLKDFLLGENI